MGAGRIQSATINVPADFPTIQEGIDAAFDGDTVFIAPGEYVITAPIDMRGKEITLSSLEEHGAHDTIIRMAEEPADPEQASVVVFPMGEKKASTLQGVMLTGGKGIYHSGREKWDGGGIYFAGNARGGTVKDCVISGNSVSGFGGGIYMGCEATISNCTISENDAEIAGGIYATFSDVSETISQCTIRNNFAELGSGGVKVEHSSPRFENCVISNNRTSERGAGGGICFGQECATVMSGCTISHNSAVNGGGVFCGSDAAPVLENCLISDNLVEDTGGGSYCIGSSKPTFTDCVITRNIAAEMHGGGVFSWSTEPVTFERCSIVRNTAEFGGGVYCDFEGKFVHCLIAENTGRGEGGGVLSFFSTDLSFMNCTIAGNVSSRGGGIVCYRSTTPLFTSCIIWNNLAGNVVLNDEAAPRFEFCCIEGDAPWDGNGNIADDPRFCGWAAAGFHVDAETTEPGDGTAERPFRSLDSIPDFSYSLTDASPCIGEGKDGGTMGADTGICALSGPPATLIHLGPGTYNVSPVWFCQHVSIMGSEAGDTLLKGTVFGLRTGSILSDLTVTGGEDGGIVIGRGEAPQLSNITLSGNMMGGVICDAGSAPELTNCHISSNDGPGLCCDGASPTLVDCTISGNSARIGAGVLLQEGASATFINCTISRNTTEKSGGAGISCSENTEATFLDCTISENETYGIRCDNVSSTLLLDNCMITGNKDVGVVCGSNAIVKNCSIEGNRGVGVSCWGDGTHLSLNNCVIKGNEDCGVSAGSTAYVEVINCTIVLNLHCGVFCSDAAVTVTNCILWHNGDGAFDESNDSAVTVFYSCLQGERQYSGTGAINCDPEFCGWDAEDVYVDGNNPLPGDGSRENPFQSINAAVSYSYALQLDSPCIGTGKDGADMGVDLGTCASRDVEHRIIHLAPGRYVIRDLNFSRNVSILGSGEETTILEGTLLGLCSGSELSSLTVTGGEDSGVVVSRDQAPRITSCTITGNKGTEGGGLRCGQGASPSVSNCTIEGNSADEGGGGISVGSDASPVFTNCTIGGNSVSGNGGGVYVGFYAAPVFTDCTFQGNSATYGGGIGCRGPSEATLIRCVFFRNTAFYDGGGAYCTGDVELQMSHCVVSSNRGMQRGGGIRCGRESRAVFTNCDLLGNKSGRGGGAYFGSDSLAVMLNCVVTGNEAQHGAGVYFHEDSVLTNCTIAGNDGMFGGDIHVQDAAPILRNCIIYGNVSEWMTTDYGDAAFCCIESESMIPGEGNLNADPLFQAAGEYDTARYTSLEINGRSYELPDFIVAPGDYRLRPGSPCLDAGALDGVPIFDKNDAARPCGAGVDMGAYEMGNCTIPELNTFIRGDANADGNINIADAVFILAYLFASGQPPACMDSADANDDGSFNISDAVTVLNYLFSNDRPLHDPFSKCGIDPTLDELDCAVSICE